jgi:nitrile hydratase
MNGVHDMGGMQCFGPVQPEADEPLFHAPWERRALALTLAMGATGLWNIDQSRCARESLPPDVYLGSSYYEIWIRALEVLLRERGLLAGKDTAAGSILQQPDGAAPRVLRAADVAPVLAKGSPADRTAGAPARFRPGDRVTARNLHPQGHTRLPRYVRGHTGTVQIVHGTHLFADRRASGTLPPFDDTAHWLYTVVFDGRDLWGPQADAGLQVSVDAWEPYLQGVPA